MGLPPEVLRDAEHWDDFLENGELHWKRPTTGFDFSQLDRDQMAALCDFLELHYPKDANIPLRGWLRVRLGRA